MKKLTALASLAILGVSTAHAGSPRPVQTFLSGLCKDFPIICADVNKDINIKQYNVSAAPEIDPATAMAGLTLLLGGLAVVRGRINKTKQD